MKRSGVRFLLAVASMAALVSCGGGGDESGSNTTFSVVPATVTFSAPVGTPAGVCVGGGTAEIFVYGGTAPFRIDNTAKDYLAVDRATVDSKGGSFTVMTLGGCISPGQIVVVDNLDRQVTVTVSNKPTGS
jgi:hypothetical protein